MGMIRVSDHAEKIIKEQANGRTISATVDALIAGGGENSVNTDSILDKLDYLENYLDKRISKLESLIEDTTVDRVNNGGPRNSTSVVSGSVKVYVPWDTAHELLYEFLPEDAPEFIGNASEQIRQADDEFPVFIQDDKLWTEDYYGTKTPILNISPRVTQFLESHK